MPGLVRSLTARRGTAEAIGCVLCPLLSFQASIDRVRLAVIAVIGPCISKRSYEVGPGFPDNFLDRDSGNYEIFTPAPRQGHFLFDFSAYVFRHLYALELKSASRLPHDTCAEADRFFSYRRSRLAGESDFGRNLSVVFLEN